MSLIKKKDLIVLHGKINSREAICKLISKCIPKYHKIKDGGVAEYVLENGCTIYCAYSDFSEKVYWDRAMKNLRDVMTHDICIYDTYEGALKRYKQFIKYGK